jgi:hypothetical protein
VFKKLKADPPVYSTLGASFVSADDVGGPHCIFTSAPMGLLEASLELMT